MASRPADLYWFLRHQLGSVRRVYVRGNAIVRHGDLGQKPETVLLLHGFMQTRAVWEVMEDRLRHDGYGVFSFNLGGLFNRFNSRPIGHIAHAIAEKVDSITDKYGLDRFHIIGHSKGGLIAREYIQNHGGYRRVKSLITLGTPHNGTPTAAIGVWLFAGGVLSKSPLQMLPGSSFVRRMRRETFPAHIPLSSIYSRSDLVCPHWCSVLYPPDGATNMRNLVVRGIGHTELTYDAGVYRLIQRSLDSASELWRQRA